MATAVVGHVQACAILITPSIKCFGVNETRDLGPSSCHEAVPWHSDGGAYGRVLSSHLDRHKQRPIEENNNQTGNNSEMLVK